MSASLAKSIYSAFNSEKPHVCRHCSLVTAVLSSPLSANAQSSITEWIEILTSDKYGGEAYDG